MWNQLCQSKICEQLDMKKYQNKVFSNISQVKPEVNCQEPFQPSFFKGNELKNRKRDRQLGQRMSFENMLLRNKMMNIDQRKFSVFNDQLDSFRANHATSKIQNRIRQANQINHENLGIQKRLAGATSMYSVKQFELDNERRKYLACNISNNARRVGYLPDPTPINNMNNSTRAKSINHRSTQSSMMQQPSQQIQLNDVNYDYGILQNSLASRNQKLNESRVVFPSTTTAGGRRSFKISSSQNSYNHS